MVNRHQNSQLASDFKLITGLKTSNIWSMLVYKNVLIIVSLFTRFSETGITAFYVCKICQINLRQLIMNTNRTLTFGYILQYHFLLSSKIKVMSKTLFNTIDTAKLNIEQVWWEYCMKREVFRQTRDLPILTCTGGLRTV